MEKPFGEIWITRAKVVSAHQTRMASPESKLKVRRSSNNLWSVAGTEGADEKELRWGCRKERAARSRRDGWSGEANLKVAR